MRWRNTPHLLLPNLESGVHTIRYCSTSLSYQLPDPRTPIPGSGYGKLEVLPADLAVVSKPEEPDQWPWPQST